MFRVTQYRTDGELCDRLVGRSRDAMRWLHSKGMKFDPIWGRQAYLIDGKFKFWGGLTVESKGGGPGLIEQHLKLAEKNGIEIRYGTRGFSLIYDGNVVRGLQGEGQRQLSRTSSASRWSSPAAASSPTPRCAPATWAPAGSSPRCAARPTTPATASTWRSPSARRASATGRAAHAVQWDYNAPEFGDLSVGDNFQKHSYPWGILINATGRRFVDEGADFRNYTYAKYGAVVLRQPNNFAWQVFDGKIVPMLRDEYRIKRVSQGLGQHHRGVRPQARRRRSGGVPRRDQEVQRRGEEGRAVQSEHQGRPLAPSASTSTSRTGPTPSRSRRSRPIRSAAALSFTFGGVRIDPDSGQVIDSDMNPIPGLYAAGELVGGIFYFNYPGGSGLMSGAVFGRIAGTGAASATERVSQDGALHAHPPLEGEDRAAKRARRGERCHCARAHPTPAHICATLHARRPSPSRGG